MNRVLLPLGNRSAEAITTLLNEEKRWAKEALERMFHDGAEASTEYQVMAAKLTPSVSVIWPDPKYSEDGYESPMLVVGETVFGQGHGAVHADGGDMGRGCHARRVIHAAVPGLAGYVSFESSLGYVTEVAAALEAEGFECYAPHGSLIVRDRDAWMPGGGPVFPLYAASGGLSGRFVAYLVVPTEKLAFETEELAFETEEEHRDD